MRALTLFAIALALVLPADARAQTYLGDCEDTGETAVRELEAQSGEGDWWTNQFVQKAG